MESVCSQKSLGGEESGVMSLEELAIKINEAALAAVPRSELFSILMSWFNAQIKRDIITQNQCLLENFVELLHLHSHTDIGPFSLTEVDEVFNGWLEQDAVQNPAYRRRYLITRQDVHGLFSKEIRQLQSSQLASQFGRQHWEGCHSATPPCERVDNSVGTEKEGVALRHISGRDTPQRTVHHSKFSASANIETDKHSRLKRFSNSKDTDADATIVIDSSSDEEGRRKATQAERQRRGRKYKVYDDLEITSPPMNYICRRCDQPGHWIQHCPTNLDPRYDQAPSQGYRCNFCGRKGDHFATLCPKNPHDGSLRKQRDASAAIAESRAFENPGSYFGRLYNRHQFSPTRSRDQYRSQSPEQHIQNRYRSRTPENRRSHRGGIDSYDPSARIEDDERQRHREESGLSPYTARIRLTQEPHRDLVNTGERRPSPRPRDDIIRLGSRSGSPSSLHRHRSSFVKKPPREHRSLDKTTKADEGRLAYDDESEAGLKSSPCSFITSPRQRLSATSNSAESDIASAAPSAPTAPDDLSRAEIETETFLRALAAEIMEKDESISRSMEVDVCAGELEVNGSRDTEEHVEESNYSGVTLEAELPAARTTLSPNCRLVQSSRFRPEIASLLRGDPIINSRTNRKTACQMMEKSEEL